MLEFATPSLDRNLESLAWFWSKHEAFYALITFNASRSQSRPLEPTIRTSCRNLVSSKNGRFGRFLELKYE
jgi:hypothetical protein